MTALWVLAGVLLLLWLIGQVRLGGRVVYSEDGLLVHIRVGRLWLQAFPAKPKRKRPAKAEKPPAPSTPKPAAAKGNSLALLRAYLPLVAEAAGRFRRKLRVDRLDLELLVAGSDPATTAMAYAWANAAIGVMIPLLENNFNIKERSARTGLSFDGGQTQVRLTAALSLTVGQCVTLGCRLAVRFLQISSQQKRTQKEAV